MSILYPRARRAASQRTRIVATIAALVVPALVLAACSDTSLPVTAPPAAAPAAEPAAFAPGEKPPNALKGIVFCDVALLSRPGRYRVRSVPIKVSLELFGPEGKTVKVGFRGAEKGTSDPGSLAVCRIPDTRAATDYFRDIFLVDSAATLKMPWRKAPQPSAPTASAVGEPVVIYEGRALYCDMVILPDETCTTPTVDVPTDIGPEPPPEDPPDLLFAEESVPVYDPSSGIAYSVLPQLCWGQTDRPHLSTTYGFWNNVNVHARTWCTSETALTVTTLLSRQSCFWFWCWWVPQGLPGFNAGFALSVEAHSNSSGCNRGYYKGSSYHTALMSTGLGTARTSNIWQIWC